MRLLCVVSTCIVGQYFIQAKNYREHFENHSSSNKFIEKHTIPIVIGLNVNNSQSMGPASNQTESNATLNMNRITEVQDDKSHHNKSPQILRTRLTYPTSILFEDFNRRLYIYGEYTIKSFDRGVLGVGINNFFSYAAYFCAHEAQEGAIEIISVGSGDGSVDRGIREAYRDHFGSTLNITLVDVNPKYKVDFRTVDNLIEKRPTIVGNCCLLIIWPVESCDNDEYDIDSICKLQPQAVLTLYEISGISGSDPFRKFLDNKKKYGPYWKNDSASAKERIPLLNQYAVKEIVYQEVHFNAIPGEPPREPWYRLRMVKVKQIS